MNFAKFKQLLDNVNEPIKGIELSDDTDLPIEGNCTINLLLDGVGRKVGLFESKEINRSEYAKFIGFLIRCHFKLDDKKGHKGNKGICKMLFQAPNSERNVVGRDRVSYRIREKWASTILVETKTEASAWKAAAEMALEKISQNDKILLANFVRTGFAWEYASQED